MNCFISFGLILLLKIIVDWIFFSNYHKELSETLIAMAKEIDTLNGKVRRLENVYDALFESGLDMAKGLDTMNAKIKFLENKIKELED